MCATARRTTKRTRRGRATDDLRDRIIAAARDLLFTSGYRALTMAALAAQLGMSKKTLYVYFPSKEAIARVVVETFAAEARAEANILLANPRLNFLEKLRGFALGMAERFGRLRPSVLEGLEHQAPDLHRYVQEVRGRNLPYIFGRFVESGQLAGVVRDDVSPVFATEYFLHAMQGIMHPDTLRKQKVGAAQAFDQGVRLFFGGLLTPGSHDDYEKLFPRRAS